MKKKYLTKVYKLYKEMFSKKEREKIKTILKNEQENTRIS